MWLQFSLGCLAAGLGSGYVAAALLRARKCAQDIEALGQALALKQQEHAALEGQLASRDKQLHQHAGMIESLQGAMTAKEGKLEAANLRCTDLELRLERRAEQEEDHLQRWQEQETALSGRSKELEALVATRDEEVSRHSATIETLQADVLAKDQLLGSLGQRKDELEERLESSEQEALAKAGQIEQLGKRCGELEQQLQLCGELEQQLTNRVQQAEEREQSVSARACELERMLEQRDDELRRRAATIELSQHEAQANCLRIEELEQRRGELELQLTTQTQATEDLRRSMSARQSELEGQLASRDEELLQGAAASAVLQRDLAEKCQQLDAAAQRGGELEQRIQRQTLQEQERLGLSDELERSLSARRDELERELANRDEELRQRATAIELLQHELAAKNRDLEATGQRCGELEQQLQRQSLEEQERHSQAQELQRCLTALQGEVEGQLASLDEELRQRAAAIELLQNEALAKGQLAESSAGRCAELERQLERAAELEQERLRNDRELECARTARTGELESQLAGRDENIRQLGADCAQLLDKCKAAAEVAQQRAVELRDCEQHVAAMSASIEMLNFAVQACHEDAEASQSLIDELVENRISALFKRRGAQGSEQLPELYLEGVERGDLGLALQGLLGDSQPLSPAAVARLCGRWREEHAAWKKSRLEREVVYLWAEGLGLKAGIESENVAMLVLVASHVDGSRSVIAAESGERGSKEAWLSMIRTLREQGMNVPRLVIGAKDLGVWGAIDELGWDCAQQHCWTRETSEVQGALPRKRQAEAGEMLRAMSNAQTRADAKKLRDKFVKRCGVRCAPAGELLCADWKQLTSFYGFPSDHWPQLRSASVAETPLTALRLRASEPRPGKREPDVDAILWKLLTSAAKNFRRLSAPHLLPSEPAREAPTGATPRVRARIRSA